MGGDFHHDIALLQLKRPLDLDNESLGRICLPAIDVTLKKGDMVDSQYLVFQYNDYANY